jgi:hypothetical protein
MFSAIANYFRLGISGRHFPKEYREGTLEYRVWKYINDHGFDDITKHFCTVENGNPRELRLAYMHRIEDWTEANGWGYPAYGAVYDTYQCHSASFVLKEINNVLLPKRLKAVPLSVSCEYIAEYGFNIVMQSICSKCLEIIEFYDSFIPKIKTLSGEVYKHAMNVNAGENSNFIINAYDGELESVLITPGMLTAFEDAVRHQFESAKDIAEFHQYCIERFRIELQKDKKDRSAHHSFPLARIPMPEHWYNLRAKYLEETSSQNNLDDSCAETLTEISRSKVLAPHSESKDNTDYYQGGKD